MESVQEIQEMTVSELREFLERQEVPLSEITSTGRTPRPVKKDLLRTALEVRENYDLTRRGGPSARTPEREINPFQSSVEKSKDGKKGSVDTTTPSPKSGTSRSRRRLSVWIEPGLLGTIEKSMGSPEKQEIQIVPDFQSPEKVRRQVDFGRGSISSPEVKEEVLSPSGASGEEFVSDWSSDGEPEERTIVELDFNQSTVKELKQHLSKLMIPYEPRAKKAELVALANAHHQLMRKSAARSSRPDDKANPNITSRSQAKKLFVRKVLRTVIGVSVLLALVAGLISVWMWFERLPFCDGGERRPFAKRCRPCPEHGTCKDGALTCDKGYVPRRASCVEDREIQVHAAALLRDIKSILDTAAGKKLCGELESDMLTSEELIAELELRNPKLNASSEKFSVAFEKALQYVSSLSDVSVSFTTKGTDNCTDCRKLLYQSMSPRQYLLCAFRMFLWNHKLWVACFVLAIVVVTTMTVMISTMRYRWKRVDEIYKEALELLQEARIAFDDGRANQAFIVDTHLRDDLLDKENQAMKTKLWALVELKMSYDTRILKSGPKKVYNVPCDVWEWKAPLPTPTKKRNL
ncbi:hypothetical protein NDN08_001022 [Rhodosorus marinus]|uniref:Man1/Src1-like C-terminal domain-containing protein n=1 Tax=Rhodosorus marinus TaxID=101924 RepID=A0AAV8UPM1_9RHOD|nr:hypothetical protein NDN08_001022 [Rhodosorus marinus]